MPKTATNIEPKGKNEICQNKKEQEKELGVV